MDIKSANNWLDKLKEYWFNKDIDNAVALFNKTAYYQETPFMKPYTTLEEIKKEWQHIKYENIKKIKLTIIAIENNTIVVNWYLEQNEDIFDGIYEIRFNNKKECIYFKSWEMMKL